jgi:hypothetical protein
MITSSSLFYISLCNGRSAAETDSIDVDLSSKDNNHDMQLAIESS